MKAIDLTVPCRSTTEIRSRQSTRLHSRVQIILPLLRTRTGDAHTLLHLHIELPVRRVLARIRLLVVEELDEVIVARGQQRTKGGPDPVDPMIALEVRRHYAGPEGAGRVERGSGVVDAGNLGYEKRETDADGRDEGVFGFLRGEHEDGEDEEGAEEL